MKNISLSAIIKTVGTAAAIVALCVLFPITAHAEGKVTVTSTNGANIRRAAGADSVIVASGLYNDTFDVLGTEKDSNGDTWYKIQVDANTVGYIKASLVTASGVSTSTTNTTTTTTTTTSPADTEAVETEPVGGTVTTDVNVRAGASTSHSVISSCRTNDKVTVVGYFFTDSAKWYRVEFTKDGKAVVGFIKADFVKLEGELVDKVEEVVEEPVVEEPVEEPVVQEPVKVYKDYEAVYNEEEETWYLEDYIVGTKYKISDLYDSLEKVKVVENESKAALSKKNVLIGILVVIIIVMIAVAVVVVIKFRKWYFEADETEKSVDVSRNERTRASRGFISRDDDDDDDDDDEDDEPIKIRRSTSEVTGRATTAASTASAVQTSKTAQTESKPATEVKPATQTRTNVGLPEGAVRLPDGRIQMPDGTIRRSVVGTRLPDGNIRLSDGRIIKPDGTPVAPAEPVAPAAKPEVKASMLDDDDDMDLSFLNGDDE